MGPLNIFAKSKKGCLTEMVSDPERFAGRYGATFTGRDRWWFGFSNGAGMWDMVGSGVNIVGFVERTWSGWVFGGRIELDPYKPRQLTKQRGATACVDRFTSGCLLGLCNSLLVRRLFGAIRVWAQLGLRGPRGA
jgi:hypothetical protein